MTINEVLQIHIEIKNDKKVGVFIKPIILNITTSLISVERLIKLVVFRTLPLTNYIFTSNSACSFQEEGKGQSRYDLNIGTLHQTSGFWCTKSHWWSDIFNWLFYNCIERLVSSRCSYMISRTLHSPYKSYITLSHREAPTIDLPFCFSIYYQFPLASSSQVFSLHLFYYFAHTCNHFSLWGTKTTCLLKMALNFSNYKMTKLHKITEEIKSENSFSRK